MTWDPPGIQGHPHLTGLNLIPPAESPLPCEVTGPQVPGPEQGCLQGCPCAGHHAMSLNLKQEQRASVADLLGWAGLGWKSLGCQAALDSFPAWSPRAGR